MATDTKLTYEDFCALPEDGNVHEIIDGVHYMNPAPVPGHQRVLVFLSHIFADYLEKHPIGEVFVAPLDILLSEHDIVEPDLIYISNTKRGIIGDKNIQGMPELLVEILSPSTRRKDFTLKKDLYERRGVLEYWIVDPDADQVQLYERSKGRLLLQQVAGRDDVITTPLLPGLEIRVERLFRRPQA